MVAQFHDFTSDCLLSMANDHLMAPALTSHVLPYLDHAYPRMDHAWEKSLGNAGKLWNLFWRLFGNTWYRMESHYLCPLFFDEKDVSILNSQIFKLTIQRNCQRNPVCLKIDETEQELSWFVHLIINQKIKTKLLWETLQNIAVGDNIFSSRSGSEKAGWLLNNGFQKQITVEGRLNRVHLFVEMCSVIR